MPSFDPALTHLIEAADADDQAFAQALAAWEGWLAAQTPRRDGLVYWMTTHVQAGRALGAQLAQCDAQALEQRLQGLIASAAGDARCLACWTLAEVGRARPEVVAGLGPRLAADPHWTVRESIANALDDVLSPAQPDFLFRLMLDWAADPDPNVRRVPTNALMRYGRLHPDQVIGLMARLRADESRYVRENVAFCLGVLGLALHPRLGHPDETNPPRLLAYLKAWAGEANRHTRWIVADTLSRAWARSVPDEARALLERLAADPDRGVARKARAALKKLTL